MKKKMSTIMLGGKKGQKRKRKSEIDLLMKKLTVNTLKMRMTKEKGPRGVWNSEPK